MTWTGLADICDELQARVKELELSLRVAESDRDTFKRYAAKMEPVVDAARKHVNVWKPFLSTEDEIEKALRELDGEKK